MRNGYEELCNVLAKDNRFVDEEGNLLKNRVQECALKTDEKLLKLLLSNKSTKNQFFIDIDGLMVFDKNLFSQVVESREFLPDSYTKFSQNILLADEYGTPLKQNSDVVLQFPNKDCILEFDSTDENENRNEMYLNEVLMKNEIDTLLSPKTFSNAVIHNNLGQKSAFEITDNDNLLIKGNNLIAMHSLLPRYKGKIKLMYWDILYNTSSDHVPYNDSFKHSSWLVMMKNRLEIAKILLRDDGCIALQCDDNEQAYLKVLCDEIFDRESFISCFNIQVRYSDKSLNEKSDFQPVNEYLLLYKKKKECQISPNKPYDEYSLEKFTFEIKELSKGTDLGTVGGKHMVCFKEGEYEIIEHKKGNKDLLKATWASGSVLKGNTSGKYFDKYISQRKDIDGLKCLYKVDGIGDDGIGYRYFTGPKKASATKGLFYSGLPLDRREEIESGKSSKKYYSITNNYDFSGDFGNCRHEGGVELVGGKKPEVYLKMILDMLTNENDLVLDAYFGTGTTGAVAMKMNRRFIGIEQLNEHYQKSLTRLNNVINGDSTGISKEVEWEGGGSFVSFELASNSQIYIDRITNSSEENELEKIYQELKNSDYVLYRVDINQMDKQADAFKALSLEEKKKFLISIIDKNTLYVNYSDINNKDYDISKDDKAFTESFYKRGDE